MPDTERHEIAVAAGESVVADHHPATEADADWFVCCHGFVSDRTGSYEGRCERAVAEGYHGVRFDFRGLGEADGDFRDATLSSRVADLRAVLDHLVPADAGVVLFGSSFGGKTALHTAVGDGPGGDGTPDERVRAIAARAPVTYSRTFDPLREAVERQGEIEYAPGYPVDERFVEDLADYDFADVAARLTVPVAVVHGRDDDSVPLADSLDAVGALETDTALWAVADEDHRFSREAEARMRDDLFGWLTRSLA